MANTGAKKSKVQGSTVQNARMKLAQRLPRTSRARWTMIFGFVLLTAFILPKDFVPEFHYELGKPWVAPQLVAEFDFPLHKATSQFEAEKRLAESGVPPVFSVDTTVPGAVLTRVTATIDSCFLKLIEYRRLSESKSENVSALRQAIQSECGIDTDLAMSVYLDLKTWKTTFLKKSSALLNEVYKIGLTDTTRKSINLDVIYVRKSQTQMVQKSLVMESGQLLEFVNKGHPGLDLQDKNMMRVIVLREMQPNLRFDAALSLEERQRAVNLVSPVFDKVAKGDVIISKGERVSEAHDKKITSYLLARTERFGTTPYMITFLGQLAMVMIVTLLLILFIRNNRPRIFFSPRKLALVLLVFLTMVGVIVLVLKLTVLTQEIAGLNYIYLAPAAMVPIILSAFFDSRFAFFGNLIVAVFAGAIVPNGFEYFFIQLCAGTAAVYSITRLRNRGDFFIALSLIFLAYVFSYVGYKFYTRGSFANIEYINLALFGLNILLTFITYPLIYVFERIFGLTSDLTYIELLDTNHPLLKELSVRAPGTFHHSIQVANLAEAVLNKIGGNSLQAKVGALFHDVGKMLNPLYFIENLGDHHNPHSDIDYRSSSEIIIRHVNDGLRLAQEHNLPTEVADFIKTHHGTTRVEYFYRKYVEEHPDEQVDIVEFQYPGPLPFTREMAVLMIADSIEAASRGLKDRSPEKLLALVEGIVDSKVRQRQFDKASLTFKDLEDAKQVIFNMLSSIYHGRVEYPAEQRSPHADNPSDANDSRSVARDGVPSQPSPPNQSELLEIRNKPIDD